MLKSLPAARKFLLLGLCLLVLASGLEVYSWRYAEHGWNSLRSPSGILASLLLAAFLLTASLLLLLNRQVPASVQRAARLVPALNWLRWSAVVGLALCFAWIFLYSPFAVDFPGLWSRYLIALCLSCLIAWILNGFQAGLSWPEAITALGLVVFVGSVSDLRWYFTSSLVSRLALVTGCGLIVWLIHLQYLADRRDLEKRLLDLRLRLGGARRFVFWFFVFSPVFLRFVSGASFYAFNPNLRFVFLMLALFAAAFLLTSGPARLFSLDAVLAASGILFTVAALVNYLYLVSDYPFSLSWSEGNRLYDYSLIFAQDIYHYPGLIINPYSSPGRYALWGLPFLWPGLPIWAHRFWGVVLRVVPPFLFGWFVSLGIRDRNLRWGLAFWVLLIFVVPTTIYAPILFSAVLIMLFAFQPSLLMRTVAVIIAGVYASLSRWTWFLAPAAWAVLVDLLLYYPERKSSFLMKILPTVVLAVCGAGSGLLLGHKSLASYAASESLSSNEPLLWYRLFPNQTFSLGIIFGILIVTGPLLALLAWWMAARRWKLDGFQMLAIWGALAGFLGAGLVVSIKIGGGGDLHNLDMYLITLAFVFAMGIYFLWREDQLEIASWPFWTQAMLCWYFALVVFPFTPFASQAIPASLEVPASRQVLETLDTIRMWAEQASHTGEVLFMDQRQLLTFGYVRGIPFVLDYEKKYMMDRALASNRSYFQGYYQDLARKRFSLIVTEPLKHVIKGENTAAFSDENDAWVRWVSDPTLCFYKPVFTDPANNVQLLVPRPSVDGCGKYLSGG